MTIKTYVLNTIAGEKDVKTGGKFKSVSFDIGNTSIANGARFKIVSIIHNGLATNTIIRIKDINYNGSYNYTSEGGFPVIFTGNLGSGSSIFLDNVLILNKQSLNYINLHFSDDIEDVNSGMLEGTNFIITIQIEELD